MPHPQAHKTVCRVRAPDVCLVLMSASYGSLAEEHAWERPYTVLPELRKQATGGAHAF